MVAGLTILSALTHRGAGAADVVLRRLELTGELAPELLFATIARGHLHLACGRADAAVADARAFDLAHRMVGAPESIIEAHTVLPLALHAAGEREAAAARLDAELARAERWGSPARIAALHRVAARIEPDTAIERLDHAVTLTEDSPLLLERARSLLELGAALRRSGRRGDARMRLQAATQIAAECGAQPLVATALEELRVLGARPRRLAFSGADALTASERRVAQLAAAGATNREIAERLFITVKTVDSHLMRAYRKLGIGSRRELPNALHPTRAARRRPPG
jgi:DNA-binding CsgD family transcriptional regulator